MAFPAYQTCQRDRYGGLIIVPVTMARVSLAVIRITPAVVLYELDICKIARIHLVVIHDDLGSGIRKQAQATL